MPGYLVTPETKSITLPIEQLHLHESVQEDELLQYFELKTAHCVDILPKMTRGRINREQYERFADRMSQMVIPQLVVADVLYQVSGYAGGYGSSYPSEAIIAPVESRDIEQAIKASADYADMKIDMPFLHITLATRPAADYAREGVSIANETAWRGLDKYLFAKGWQA